ncbi:MAG: hypothetical protein JXQ82_07665 [Methanomicrobiaceae archaeon]|nr:hypothetical protein [Methanomicrobiaceae archaeon]
MVRIKGEGNKRTVYTDEFGEGRRCPFLTTRADSTVICIKEECMLWNEEKQTCNINVIAESKR